jgi:hypothetical protein
MQPLAWKRCKRYHEEELLTFTLSYAATIAVDRALELLSNDGSHAQPTSL